MPSEATDYSGLDHPSSRHRQIPVWILTTFAVGYLAHEAALIFIWVVSSFFLFVLIDRPLASLTKRGFSPFFSALALVSLFGLAVAGAFSLLYYFAPDLNSEFVLYKSTITKIYSSISRSIGTWMHAFSKMDAAGSGTSIKNVTPVEVVEHGPLRGTFGMSMLHGLGAMITVVTFAILCPVLTFFMIAERKSFASVLKRAFRDSANPGVIWNRLTEMTSAFFIGNLVLVAVTFPLFALIFRFFGVESPIFLAGLSSILNAVPFLGSVLCGALPVLNLLAHQGAFGQAMGLFAVCLLVHFTVANLVTPKLLGSKVDLNATTSTIALIVWGELWGAMGLLLAIPLTAGIKILFQYSDNGALHWLAMLMSDDPESLLHTLNHRVPSFLRGYEQAMRFGNSIWRRRPAEDNSVATEEAVILKENAERFQSEIEKSAKSPREIAHGSSEAPPPV